jgi:hypothetical protein
MLTITAKYLRPAGKRGARVQVHSESHAWPARVYPYPHDAFDAKRHCIREYIKEMRGNILRLFDLMGYEGEPTICWLEVGFGGREVSMALISFPEEHESLPLASSLLNWDEDYIKAVID